jgi:hypothetical protein
MQLADVPAEATVFAMIALYEKVENYEQFCLVLDLDPAMPESEAFFEEVHRSYADLWFELGDDEFVAQIETHKDYIT